MTMPSEACYQAGYIDDSKTPVSGSHPAPTKTFEDVDRFLKQGKLKEAKVTVRKQHWPIHHPRRGDLWYLLATYHRSKGSPGCHDETEPCSPSWSPGLPSFVDPLYCEDFCLGNNGRRCCERLLHNVSLAYPFVSYCPLLYPLTALFLHYLGEEKAYDCVSCLLEGTKVRHLSQTRLMHHTSARTLKTLTRKLCKKTYTRLQKVLRQEEDIDTFFRTWELWVFRALPFGHVVRVTDCFLLEGVRALYRCAMALIILSISELTSGPKGAAPVDAGVLLERMVSFCKMCPVNVDVFLEVAYGIKGISGKSLNDLLLKAEASVRSWTSTDLPPLPSCHSLPVQQERYDRVRSASTAIVPKVKSQVLDADQLGTLWTWLPARIAMQEPRLIFTTNEHGCSITSFFQRCEIWEPTLILIRTTQDERLGVYCSTQWAERHKERSYFGTGESFVFAFDGEKGSHYPWVGARSHAEVPASSRLFQCADQKMIQVGGGNGFALYVDSSLEHGRTQHCDTFDNPPLVKSGEFVVGALEVLGFE
ncbi:GTPase-activating protein skywalker-like [Ornithodoros turicata]